MFRIGHRGTTRGEAENTPSAFRKALREGGDGVEFDIRMSRDGTLVLMHDPRVDRITGKTGYVKDMDLKSLKSLKIKNSEERITTSEEAFASITESGKAKVILIDLKVQGAARKLIGQICERNLQDVAIIISFHKDLLKEIKELDGRIKTGLIRNLPTTGPIDYLASETEENRFKLRVKDSLYRLYLYSMLLANRISGSVRSDLITDAKAIGADYAMFFWGAATKSFVNRAHRSGLGVVAGMVNSEKGIKRLERLGVDGIVTDLSELLRTD